MSNIKRSEKSSCSVIFTTYKYYWGEMFGSGKLRDYVVFFINGNNKHKF